VALVKVELEILPKVWLRTYEQTDGFICILKHTLHTYIHNEIYNALHSRGWLESEARAVARWRGLGRDGREVECFKRELVETSETLKNLSFVDFIPSVE